MTEPELELYVIELETALKRTVKQFNRTLRKMSSIFDEEDVIQSAINSNLNRIRSLPRDSEKAAYFLKYPRNIIVDAIRHLSKGDAKHREEYDLSWVSKEDLQSFNSIKESPHYQAVEWELTQNEKKCMKLFFDEGYTVSELKLRFRRSKERIRRILTRAVRKIQLLYGVQEPIIFPKESSDEQLPELTRSALSRHNRTKLTEKDLLKTIGSIIEDEDKKKPLTDADISMVLWAKHKVKLQEDGIASRRMLLGIPNSILRLEEKKVDVATFIKEKIASEKGDLPLRDQELCLLLWSEQRKKCSRSYISRSRRLLNIPDWEQRKQVTE